MKLSTRLALAMVVLVILTAGAVGALTYRNIEAAVLPRALARLELEAKLMAEGLESAVHGARANVLGFRAAVALNGIMRASQAGGKDPVDGTTLDEWRQRMAQRYAAELAANPLYTQFRIIAAADDGREIVRVDRSGPDGAVRIVPDAELRPRGERDYVRRALGLPDGAVYVSPVELDRELGAGAPSIPVLRVATPAHDADGRAFGVIVINVDMRPAFDRIRAAVVAPARVFVVDARGDYLVHPDPKREFGLDRGHPYRIGDEFPGLAQAPAGDNGRESRLVTGSDGVKYAVALARATLAGGTPITVIDLIPYASLLASVDAAGRGVFLGGSIAVLCAVGLAVLLARSLTRPLARMTGAVEAFAHGEAVAVPTEAGGEIGTLARAFQRMSADVTEKTATIRQNAEIFDSIMAGMADGVILVDEHMRNVFVNPAARAFLGPLSETDWYDWLAGQEIFHADGVTPLRPEETPRWRACHGEKVDNFEVAIRMRDQKSLVHAVISARPILAGGGTPKGAVVVFRDVTTIRETERQLREAMRLDAIGQLTGGVAHDFNNLLTVIIGNIEALAEGLADRPKLAALAKSIDDAATRGAELTRQLLAFARRQPLEPRATDANALVIAAATLLRPTLGEHIEIESALADDLWPAMVDPSQLTTALVNLAVNARDAMPRGGKLTIETDNVTLDETYAVANRDVQPGHYVMIAVSDTGTGIPEAIRDRVFEPFFTTKDVGKGTGLGLSMVYGFLKQSKGHVKLYSEEGHGTTIKLYMPRALAEGEVAQVTLAGPLPLGKETILVVEDDDLVRGHVVAQLESLGYRTLAAPNGAAALALVDEGARFDLLFTDVIMPGGMSGRQLADELTRRWPSLRVLYTSGYTEDAVVHHGRLDAGVALLNKPYRKAELARKVREALDANPATH
ncbi:MAG TPA: ATP-binding protein [Alphaproteobacteria bacterium]|nr:ATP-binding protein [Alphaproteobacteria bacterium]